MSAAIRAQFDRCRDWLTAALAVDGESTPEELLADLLAGRAQLWPGEACCVVTQFVLHPEHGPTIHAWCGGGILREMLTLRPGVEAYGRAMGAAWATLDSRKGWDRLYGPHGYERHGGILRKRLL